VTPAQLDAIRDRATRPRRTVPIVLDGDLSQAIAELLDERDRLEAAAQKPPGGKRLGSRLASPVRVNLIDSELDVLYGQAAESTLQVVIEGLAGTDYDALRAQYPARDDHPIDKMWRFNIDAAGEALIRACAIGYRDGDGETIHPWTPPVLDEQGAVVTPGQLDWLLGFVTDWQRDVLRLSALNCCRGDDAVPLRQPRSETTGSDAA